MAGSALPRLPGDGGVSCGAKALTIACCASDCPALAAESGPGCCRLSEDRAEPSAAPAGNAAASAIGGPLVESAYVPGTRGGGGRCARRAPRPRSDPLALLCSRQI